jgi:4-diphosphocytidyl-2-C-methyl-D-erythritol kinase
MIIRSYAKVNVYLKIVGFRGNYHELNSRFIRVKSLFDTLRFETKSDNDPFTLDGDFSCELSHNTIYKVYALLKEQHPTIAHFFKRHKVVVDKQIPEFAGLGGGSSNAAAFLNLTNRLLKLGITKDALAKLGAKVGADIPFFVYEFDSANVSGIGEVVNAFDEEIPDIETITPSIQCSTKDVYRNFRALIEGDEEETFNRNRSLAAHYQTMSSRDILAESDATKLNDLYLPAKQLYSTLEVEGYPYFSGSGSSFFRISKR